MSTRKKPITQVGKELIEDITFYAAEHWEPAHRLPFLLWMRKRFPIVDDEQPRPSDIALHYAILEYAECFTDVNTESADFAEYELARRREWDDYELEGFTTDEITRALLNWAFPPVF